MAALPRRRHYAVIYRKFTGNGSRAMPIKTKDFLIGVFEESKFQQAFSKLYEELSKNSSLNAGRVMLRYDSNSQSFFLIGRSSKRLFVAHRKWAEGGDFPHYEYSQARRIYMKKQRNFRNV